MENRHEITGKVVHVGDLQEFNSGFAKREVVVDNGDKYPNPVKLEFVKDKVDLLDGVANGDTITVHYNLRGNEYNGRYYVNLVGWKLEMASGSSSQNAREGVQDATGGSFDGGGSTLPNEPSTTADEEIPF